MGGAQAPLGRCRDQALLDQHGKPGRVEIAAGKLLVARDIDPLHQAQAHQEKFIALLLHGQEIVDDGPVAMAVDQSEPAFRMAFGGDRGGGRRPG